MPLSTYMKLTDERPAETDIKLTLASHSYIYPLGIAEDVLVEVTEHVYPIDLIILDIKENEKRPFILGTPFLTTAKAVIKFDKGTITLRSGKNKIRFNRILESLCKDEKRIKNDIEPIAPTMTLNRLVLNIWKAFGGNTHDLGSFGEETDKTIDLHQNLLKIMLTERGDGVASIKRRRHDLQSNGVSTLVASSEYRRPKGTLEDSVSREYGYSSVEGDLRKFNDIGAWVQVPRCMAWLDYDEHIDSLSTMDNEVGVTSPESTTQTLSSFEEYTPPVTYPEEVEETLGTLMEVEPLDKTQLEDLGLNTCNHDIPLSSREVPSFDEPKPQPKPLANFPTLDVSLGDERGPQPPSKPISRMF
ncbi:zinc finger, CCHC-type containing protein [Tanacetum coccineum]